jgi:AraC-like DNA-binding protein
VDKVVFSSDQLPRGLDETRRFKAWCDLYNEFVGRGDLVPTEAPFEATMAFVQAKDVVIGRVSATVRDSEHGGTRATTADEARVGLLINIGDHPAHARQRGHEATVTPGGCVFLSRADLGRFTFDGDKTAWVIIDMPRLAITRAAPGAENLFGRSLNAGGEALRLVTTYTGMILGESSFNDPRIEAHIAQTILDLVGLALGAEEDAAELAREHGLRAARLDAVLQAIADGYADPSFSIATVARTLRLSERTIQDLLQPTGSGFAERVMELRLQRSVSLLARAHLTQRKISDVALSSGFNDVSYFHRCFRRRFGMTPAGART